MAAAPVPWQRQRAVWWEQSAPRLTSNWPTISLGTADYAGNLRNGATGANQLNLGIVLLGNGTTQPVDMIRRPFGTSESASVTNLRYFAEASIQVLLSDNPTDIMSLPCIDTSTQPVNLAQLATPVTGWTALGGNPAALYTKMNANNTAGYQTLPVPMAASGAASGDDGLRPGRNRFPYRKWLLVDDAERHRLFRRVGPAYH